MARRKTEQDETPTADKVEVFLDDAGQYRWHRIAANHEVISTSGEAFVSKDNAIRAAYRANPEARDEINGVKVYLEGEDTPL